MSFENTLAEINNEGYGSIIWRHMSSVFFGNLTYFSTILTSMDSIILSNTEHDNFKKMAVTIYSIRKLHNQAVISNDTMMKIATKIVKFFRLANNSNELKQWNTFISKTLLRLIISNCATSNKSDCVNEYSTLLSIAPNYASAFLKSKTEIGELRATVELLKKENTALVNNDPVNNTEAVLNKINAKISSNSGIVARRNDSNGDEYPSPETVSSTFDELMDAISHLQLAIVSQMDKNSLDFETRKNLWYSKILKMLFEPQLKSLYMVVQKHFSNKQEVAKLLLGGVDTYGGKTTEEMKAFVAEIYNKRLIKLIPEGMDEKILSQMINDCVNKSILLGAQIILSEPKMSVIMPKKGKAFNSWQCEDATAEYQLVNDHVKRPGLMCEVDGKIFQFASVTTIMKTIKSPVQSI